MSINSNKPTRVFAMILFAAAVLFAISVFQKDVTLGEFKIHKIDLFSKIRKDDTPVIDIKKDTIKLAIKPLIDTLFKAKMDEPAVLADSGKIVSFSDSLGLNHFFQALGNKKKVRIAWFGDSMIEGDLITQDVRSMLQKRFGGSGVGFMPVTSVVAGFRQSIIHGFSQNWLEYKLTDAVSSNHPLGITGKTFVPNVILVDSVDVQSGKGFWVKYSGVKAPFLEKFQTAKLFYGKGDEQTLANVNGKNYKLNGTDVVNMLSLATSPLQSINCSFFTNKMIDIFGFSFESDSGVIVDNFSFRGNSGMPLTKMNASVLKKLNSYLDYDLIVLQYGVNVINNKVTDFSWYQRGMNEVVSYLKGCFPNTSILLISAGDKSYRENGKYETDPSVLLVVDAQRKVAQKNQIAFWNLYAAMGGKNSMVKWVEGDTVFANKDYTHLNFRGAKRVAGLFYDRLLEAQKGKFNHRKDLSIK